MTWTLSKKCSRFDLFLYMPFLMLTRHLQSGIPESFFCFFVFFLFPPHIQNSFWRLGIVPLLAQNTRTLYLSRCSVCLACMKPNHKKQRPASCSQHYPWLGRCPRLSTDCADATRGIVKGNGDWCFTAEVKQASLSP